MNRFILFLAIGSILTACAGKSNQDDAVILSQQKAIDSMNAVAVKQRTVDSMKTVNRRNEEKIPQNSSTTVTSEKKKKGWNKTEKGAVIGAGVGALTGAIVDKKHRGQGAVIGGVSGAVLGAGTGAVLDSKNK